MHISIGSDRMKLIREAMLALSGNAKTLAEPSGAVAVAAFLFHADELPDATINVAVISGGNIDPQILGELRKSSRRIE